MIRGILMFSLWMLSWILVIIVPMSVFTFLAFLAGHFVMIALRLVGAAP